MQKHFYRPQTKFAKVMFLHLSVGHSVHKRGGVLHPERSASRGVGNPPRPNQILRDTVDEGAVLILV